MKLRGLRLRGENNDIYALVFTFSKIRWGKYGVCGGGVGRQPN
jgi:hypothetical protein